MGRFSQLVVGKHKNALPKEGVQESLYDHLKQEGLELSVAPYLFCYAPPTKKSDYVHHGNRHCRKKTVAESRRQNLKFVTGGAGRLLD